MKTSTQIIEEAVENYDNYLSNNVPLMCRFEIKAALNQFRSALVQAMKTAVEEVTPDKDYPYDAKISEIASDMEEKKRKFFEE
jgi:hypothetical protein